MRTLFLTFFLALAMAVTLWLAALHTAKSIAKVHVQQLERAMDTAEVER
jgi:hypothetical protein